MSDVLGREIPKVPALRGKTVVSLFYEDSTRTRLSFETAAKRLSADTMTFTAGSSSVKKGESLLDTVKTIEAMGIDAMVVRHSAAGAPHRIAGWIDAAVVNAGDGRHGHPTQALLDAFTLRRHRGDLTGARIGIVGDVRNSRVARSGIQCWSRLGAEVTLIGPPTLMPERLDGWPVTRDRRPRRRADRARRRLRAARAAGAHRPRAAPEPARVLRPVGAERRAGRAT